MSDSDALGDTSDRSHTAPQQGFAALRHPQARSYLLLSTVSMMADNMEHVISYWIVFERFQSPALGGLAVITHWLPFLLFSVWAGALGDRYDPRRIIQAGVGLFALASLGWGVLFMTGWLTEWSAALILIVHGMAGVIWQPASQLLVHDIVGKTQLQSAIRLMSTARQLGMLLGPAVGGLLLIVLGPAWGILLNALFYLPLIVWLERWRRAAPRAAPGSRGRSTGLGLAEVLETARRIAGNRIIVSMTLIAGLTSLLVGNAHQAQMPEFAHDLHAGHGHGGGGADMAYTVLLAANAAGALVAGIVLESRNLLAPSTRTVLMLVMGWCITLIVFAVTQSYALAVTMMLAAGFLNLAFSAMTQTLVQSHAPPEIRGRVIGLYNMSAHGLRTFSGVTVGLGGSLIGIHWSLALSALSLGAVALAVFRYTSLSRDG